MSNVVQLKKPTAPPKNSKPRSNTRSAKKPASDAALIRACVAFAQNVAANDAGYDVDPTDSKYAAPMGKQFSAKYEMGLRRMVQLSATTPEGVDAKARAAPIVIHNAGRSPDERELMFFKSFAADVHAVLKPIIHERWKAEKAAERELKAKAVQS